MAERITGDAAEMPGSEFYSSMRQLEIISCNGGETLQGMDGPAWARDDRRMAAISKDAAQVARNSRRVYGQSGLACPL